MTAVDAYELQNLINKVKSGPVLVPQNATFTDDYTGQNLVKSTTADDGTGLQYTVKNINISISSETIIDLDRDSLPDQAQITLMRGVSVQMSADNFSTDLNGAEDGSPSFKNQFSTVTTAGEKAEIIINNYTDQDILSINGTDIEANNIDVVVRLSESSVADISSTSNLLSQAESVVFTDSSELIISEAQALELKDKFTIDVTSSESQASVLIKGYDGSDLSAMFAGAGNDTNNDVNVVFQLSAPLDVTADEADLIGFVEDADFIDLNGYDLTLTAQQTEVLKDKLVNYDSSDQSNLIVKGYTNQDLTTLQAVDSPLLGLVTQSRCELMQNQTLIFQT